MPEKRIIGKFVPKQNFDKEKFITEKISKTRLLCHEKIEEANNIPNRIFRRICLLSIIDSFAQEYSNYPTDSSGKTFCKFVLRFQNCCDYLELIEPVTLFYDYEPKIPKNRKNNKLVKEFPHLFSDRLEVNITDLGSLDEKLVSEVIRSGKAEEILSIIKRDCSEKEYKNYERNHRMINLIYKMRSKAVHELSPLGMESCYALNEGLDKPHYRDVLRLFKSDDNIASSNVFELVIPSDFIYLLTQNVVDNYLDWCDEEQRMPFENNSNFKRLVSISWRG